ncbi:TPA: hypothetical protein N2G15_002102 [Salmonella enterica]|uniref:hypothetical protein n=1 Tax=Salmonella enterica TaxID=28901 RepID=UPI001590E783|nr:hypothetical protein [Salmonella enterica]HBC0142723.1 hypothetical protein [Salmonella enterica subsp. indica serovar 11:b:e,n,x]HBC0166985.1 hypothetical protein [Salmonella enterica subsp. indica]HBC0169523.1 hypothetical protein [Salmonella enterica subsp. indica]HBZ5822726.1 hypothetical protein [Salmonella enterica]HCL5297118.1 hypothetical protein [Salmonella enterica]
MEPIVDAIKLRKTDGQASFEKMMEVVAGEIKKQICFRKIIDSIALNFASIVGGFTFFFCLYALLRFDSWLLRAFYIFIVILIAKVIIWLLTLFLNRNDK